MKISIVTACYNSEQTIERTIQSVLAQTYTNIEYIIIDGGSKDKTLEIINQYANKISRIVSEKDGGIYDALNKGIANSTGDFIGFLHADDAFASNDVITQIANLAQNSDAVYADLQYVSATGKVIRHWNSGLFLPKLLKRGWMPPHPTLYVKRTLYSQIGGFDLSYKIASDYDFMLRLLSVDKLQVAYLSQVTVLMMVGGASNKSLKNIIKKSKEDYRALKSNKIGGFGALFFKNFGKIGQFLKKNQLVKPSPSLELLFIHIFWQMK